MKSGFCYTNPERENQIKPLNLLFKYNFTIKLQKNAIIIMICFPIGALFYFLWFSCDVWRIISKAFHNTIPITLAVLKPLKHSRWLPRPLWMNSPMGAPMGAPMGGNGGKYFCCFIFRFFYFLIGFMGF